MSVELGSQYRLTYDVFDATSTLVNPTTVTLVITRPDGTPAPGITVTNPPANTGHLLYDYVTTQPGRHTVSWSTTGPVTAGVDEFNVAAADAGWIVSLAQTKAHLNITTTSQDDELELFIAAATAKIRGRCGPVVRATTLKRVRTRFGQRSVWLEPPVISLTSIAAITTGSTSIAVADLDVDPDSGRVTYLSGTCFPGGLYLWTYVEGLAVIPAPLQLAALNYVRGAMETQRGASGLPWQGANDEVQQVPNMGLVLWRLEQDLIPFAHGTLMA